ncbi:putative photosynthetic complex assembly protein PuhE [Methylobacterium nigriterrae]|uniref:putative photosynthetic complex assembly protein PuhE n=1 Tax=Methylobacterium nigriterrae TaxID=3127512 RepID=UPI00301413CD
MSSYAVPPLYAVAVWWFSTGLIILLDHLPRRTFPWSMAGASLVLAASLWLIGASAGEASEAGAYTAFTAALLVWGWQEISYYMGFVSGPRPHACPPGTRGLDRFRAAAAASLWHEAAIVVGALAILALTWDGPNRFALWTYLVLWGMNLSARLNMFLGVRNLNAEFLPDHLSYLGCFLARKPMNLLFPVSVSLATLIVALLGRTALAEEITPHEVVGFTILTTLMALATLEHWFLMLPLPSAALWQWSLPARADKPAPITVTAPEPVEIGRRDAA